ncbi:MAG TPA: DegT/DnrJ/EryC1/StrS family aminotransferase [Rhodospirillales bacterium]|jgi:CDP-6-deoxy-D-xylo-4-hexulose-3-dehydrase|nr:DegT/DnrJ/EryC1/StrS family aminotransferase [Rhodospirillales bacterium]HIL75172.1 DegT/DnrJ/EryC1/StrS family aminotransferase [Rhodospirillales bacterium]
MSYKLAASSWGQEELNAIQRVINSEQFSMGSEVAAFEKEFAAWHNLKYGVMVNSGSSANLISIASYFYKNQNPLKRGDEVIVPAISWSTTYYPLQQYGLKLKFIDVEIDSFNIDITKLEEALTPRTKIIIAVSILGNPAALDQIKSFADKHGLYFMEDNCESLGAELPDKSKTGTFGDLNTFSFFFSHHIATMEGGMVLTNDKEFFHLLRSIRNHGWTRDVPTPSEIYDEKNDDFFEAYRFILPGYNVRPIEMAGAIGREQLKKLTGFIEKRRKNLSIFQRLFGNDERFIIQKEYGKSSAFSFPLVLNPAQKPARKKILGALKKANVEYRIITGGCFPRHDVIKYFDYDAANIDNANIIHEYGLFFGNYPIDLTNELNQAYNIMDATFK